jgi:hypothetical protein
MKNIIHITKPNISQNKWHSIGTDTEAMNVPGGCIVKSIIYKSEEYIRQNLDRVINKKIPIGISTLFLQGISVIKWYRLITFRNEEFGRLEIDATANFELGKTIDTLKEPQRFFMADSETPKDLKDPTDYFIQHIINHKIEIYNG